MSTRRRRERVNTGHISADPTLALAPSGKDHLESDIQHRLIDRARTRGCYVRKIVSIAHRGMPDLVLIRGGMGVMWEVKRTAGTVTKLQQLEHAALRKAGASVVVTFGLADAFRELDNWFP
jgi:hypothetical protein